MSRQGNRFSVWPTALCLVFLCLVSESASQSSSVCKKVKAEHKVHCGCPPITQAECQARGCCYDGSSSDFKCYFPDINKCLVDNGGCSPNADCSSKPGSVTCKCRAGYSGNGYNCEDIDECALNNGGCNWNNSICVNTPGSSFCACDVGLTETGFQCRVPGNIALGKTAYQSSTVAAAARAVDGILNPTYSHSGSCSMTGGDFNPWWAVDLGEHFYVSSVLLTNRGDAFAENMNNFFVGLTDNPPQTFSPSLQTSTYTLCGQWPGVAPAGRTLPVLCTPGLHPARYVLVLTQRATLTICELQVFGKVAKNLALRRTTWQSSTHEAAVSSRAVDGNDNTNPTGNSCSMTNGGDINSWWAVDLGTPHKIHSVVLSNRNDHFAFRMDHFKVGLSNSSPNEQNPMTVNYNHTLCGQYQGIARQGQQLPVTCTPGLPAFRYVIITTHRSSMTICELKVFETIE